VAIAVAVDQIAFNWHAYYRARAQTRPLAVASVLTVVFFAALPIPLLLTDGLRGYGWGLLGVALLQLVVRGWYLGRLFGGFSMVRHVGRALAPSVLPALAILGWRAVGAVDRGGAEALAELIVYLGLTVLTTALLERELLRELWGYLRREPAAPPVAPAPSL
jgi:O-antigen/teichoic acid export membrane protein